MRIWLISGSKDGYVYAYHLKRKEIAWKFLAAPTDERILYASQLESHWPVGNLKIADNKVKVIAGRHEVTGGYFIYELDPRSGETFKKRSYHPRALEVRNAKFSVCVCYRREKRKLL